MLPRGYASRDAAHQDAERPRRHSTQSVGTIKTIYSLPGSASVDGSQSANNRFNQLRNALRALSLCPFQIKGEVAGQGVSGGQGLGEVDQQVFGADAVDKGEKHSGGFCVVLGMASLRGKNKRSP